jgi:hypothetical protein
MGAMAHMASSQTGRWLAFLSYISFILFPKRKSGSNQAKRSPVTSPMVPQTAPDRAFEERVLFVPCLRDVALSPIQNSGNFKFERDSIKFIQT